VESLYVARISDLDRFHDVSKRPVGSRHDNAILGPNFTQGPKECITMSGDADVPGGPRKSSTVNVPGGHSKDFRSSAFENHYRKVKAGDLDSSNRLSTVRRNNNESMWKSSIM
jgi:hypothetical protein